MAAGCSEISNFGCLTPASYAEGKYFSPLVTAILKQAVARVSVASQNKAGFSNDYKMG